MAKTPVLTVPDTAADFDMPEEFVADEAQAANGVNYANIGFDDARDEADRRRLIAPAGDWLKTEQWPFDETRNVRINAADKQPGDINPAGRTSFTFYGYPDERQDREGNAFRPFLRIQFSPDRRMHREKEGQFDYLYKMFIGVKDLYIAIYKAKPKSIADLLRMLAEDTYVINTANGDDGPFVMRLKAPREQR